jgi:ABC-type dipeptide/oligopeptide/nickel transport system ATPase component
MPLLSLKNLSISFANQQVVKDFSFDLSAQKITALVGQSGSGKSLTALAILGLARKAKISGEIIFAGKNLLALSEKDFCKIRGKEIGMVFQDPNSSLNPLHKIGKQIAEAIVGKFRVIPDTTAAFKQYWNQRYVTASAVQLEELLETTMKASLFERIKTPTLLLYFYKSEAEQDPVVKVSAMKRMFNQLGTPDSLKHQQALPNVGNHVMGSWVKSKDLNSVQIGRAHV